MLNFVLEENMGREAFVLEQPETMQELIEDQQSVGLEALRLWLARVPRTVGARTGVRWPCACWNGFMLHF
jgi:hypothetical protein